MNNSGTKICSICKTLKELNQFYDNNSKTGKRSRCKECHIQVSSLTRSKKDKRTLRNEWLKTQYDISLLDYNIMLIRQDGLCAICGIHQKDLDKILVVDHDHESGVVRELLCDLCNKGLGCFSDNPRTLLRAIEYLNNHNKNKKELYIT